MKSSKYAKYAAMGGIIAAIYVVLTSVSAMLGIASGSVQFRISEILCILPMFTPSAIPGLAIGCLLSNILTGGVIWDVVFGTVATLIGAIGTRLLRKHRWIAPLCPVVSNMIIIPFILQYAYNVEDAYWILVITVGLGEFACAYLLGESLFTLIIHRRIKLKITDKE